MSIVLTGFGSFGSFAENPSTDVVSDVEQRGIPGYAGKLKVFKNVPVDYAVVSNTVPKLWEDEKPDLIVHVGAHPETRCVKFEQQSFVDGYCRFDVSNCVPENNVCSTVRNDAILRTDIDCDELASHTTAALALQPSVLRVEKSTDPGRYLCGFIYYMSLSRNASRALFIHVPAFDDQCTRELVADVVRTALAHIIEKYCNMKN